MQANPKPKWLVLVLFTSGLDGKSGNVPLKSIQHIRCLHAQALINAAATDHNRANAAKRSLPLVLTTIQQEANGTDT